MDYKIIILSSLILFFLIVLYRELTSIKRDVATFKKTVDHASSDIQNNVNHCVLKIKNICTDNLQQLRKNKYA